MPHDVNSPEIAPENVGHLKVDSRNPYVFVVGCPRSGTTLLQRMLNSHPMLAVANDTHFITRCLEKISPQSIPDAIAGKEIPLTDELAAAVRDYRRFPRSGLTARQAEAERFSAPSATQNSDTRIWFEMPRRSCAASATFSACRSRRRCWSTMRAR